MCLHLDLKSVQTACHTILRRLVLPDCFPCIRNLHDACKGGDCTCSHAFGTVTSEPDNNNNGESSTGEKRSRRNKPDAAVKDQQSTGRKRAAKLYPLDPEANCEWLGKQAMGGGSEPIDGCPVADDCLQQARHHGPDKNTLNNEPGNVHRIGHKCHNRWHAKNDASYDPSKPLLKD